VPLYLTLAGKSDVGRVRRRNEDSFRLAPELGIAVVADGMGGHPGGDVASRIAAERALERLREPRAPGSMERAMSDVVLSAHAAVRDRGASEPALSGMGTTLTAFLADVVEEAWCIGHVGDSRAYLLRGGAFCQLTRDDTWVQRKVDADELTPAQARHHPFGHILTQCLGSDAPPVVQVLTGSLEAGDLFLLCSDGLVGMLDDEMLYEILLAHTRDPAADVESAARSLVTSARERGGFDNITVALVAAS